MFRIYQSETFVVKDCILTELDDATYSLSTPSASQTTIKSFVKNGTYYIFEPPFCFEFDVLEVTNPQNVRLRIMEQDTSPIYLRNFDTLTSNGHIKCIVTETGTEWFVDGVSKYTATGNAENPFGIALIVLSNSTGSITIKNVEAYPI